jgi:predicted membrane chloride channel (bestrophin family)
MRRGETYAHPRFYVKLKSVMRSLSAFLKIVDLHTFAVTFLAILATNLSRRFGLVAELPIDLIGLAVVFPLVFSINSAYRMREDALQAFASLKGNAAALFYAHRDWGRDRAGSDRARRLIDELLHALLKHIRESSEDGPDRHMARIFEIYSEISVSIERLRKQGASTQDIARANEYLKNIMVDVERMNNIARYRTPVSLRAFTRVFLNLLPILFGPHFASIDYPDYPAIGYMVAGLYGFILVSLDNVQDHLENPFDGIGVDDLRLSVVDEMIDLLEE